MTTALKWDTALKWTALKWDHDCCIFLLCLSNEHLSWGYITLLPLYNSYIDYQVYNNSY